MNRRGIDRLKVDEVSEEATEFIDSMVEQVIQSYSQMIRLDRQRQQRLQTQLRREETVAPTEHVLYCYQEK